MTRAGDERDDRHEDDATDALDRSRAVEGRPGDVSPTPESGGPMEEFIEPASSSVDPPLPPRPEDARPDLSDRGEA